MINVEVIKKRIEELSKLNILKITDEKLRNNNKSYYYVCFNDGKFAACEISEKNISFTIFKNKKNYILNKDPLSIYCNVEIN